MAVTAVHELWAGRDGEWTEDQRSYTRVFRVETNDKADHAGVIETYVGIPKVGEPFPADYNARCVSVSPRSESFSPFIWLTTCTYRSKSADEGSPPEFDPTDDRAVIRWNTETYQRVCHKAYWSTTTADDANPRPTVSPTTPEIGVVNSAGDPFDPPVMIDDCRFGVSVTKNLSTVPIELLSYVNSINDAEITIDNVDIELRRLKVMSVSVSDWKERNWTDYREVNVAFSVATVDHIPQQLDQGFRQKVQLTSGENEGEYRRKNITNEDGSQPNAPVLLNGMGEPLVDPSLDNAVFVELGVYPERDFDDLKSLLGF